MPVNEIEKVRVAVVDDDRPSVDVLLHGLAEYPWAEVCATGATSEDCMDIIGSVCPDILFIDIELNEDSAFDVLSAIDFDGRKKPKIVFYSSYRRYLLQAIRVHAFDFLLKPFDPEELALIMNRYRLGLRRERETAEAPQIPRQLPGLKDPRALAITTITNDRMILAPHKIVLFKYDSERKLWEVVLDDFQHIILKRHTTAETILNYGPDFIRTHKAYIINITYLGIISSTECSLIPPYDRISDIKISKAYKRRLLERFYDL